MEIINIIKKMKWLLLLVFVAFAHGELVQEGKCPEMHAVTDFQKERLLGRWYMQKHYEDKRESDYICVMGHYELWEDNKLLAHAYAISLPDRIEENVKLKLTFAGEEKTAKFKINVNLKGVTVSGNYQIVDTDYENYQINWQCTEENDKSKIMVWVKSRKRIMSKEILGKVMETLKKYNLDESYLIDIPQEDC